MSCAQCGKQRKVLKRCSRCKKASSCGAECQNAAWKGHKKTCVNLDDMVERVNAASFREDWQCDRDQGDVICRVADHLLGLRRRQEAKG